MSASRHRLWLGFYPRAWRARYGEELEALLAEMDDGEGSRWRARRDLVRAGCSERLRSWGLRADGVTPGSQAKAGTLLVLCAWTLFVVGGLAVQRFSEHWQGFAAASGRALPSGAFHALLLAALIGSGLVLAGGAVALTRLPTLLRAGGWREIRRPVLRAVIASAVAAAAITALALWAHRLDALQRNGRDPLYGIAFAAGGLLVIACLAAWSAALVSTARRLELSKRLLAIEVGLAVAVSLAMLVMTIATAVWWAALASQAPWALHGQASGPGASPIALQLLVAMALMAIATVLAGVGSTYALRALSPVAQQQKRAFGRRS